MRPINQFKRDEVAEFSKGRIVGLWIVYMRKYKGRARHKRMAIKNEEENG